MTPLFGTESRRCFTALCLVLVLGACQTPEGISDSATAGSDATQDDLGPAGSSAKTEEEAVMTEGQSSLEGNEGESGPPAIALQPGPPIDDDPGQLMGLDPIGLEQRLGAPELRRREPPAEVWQYRTASCILDLFLYAKSGIKEVVYMEARDFTAAEIETRQCLRGLLLERQSAAEG